MAIELKEYAPKPAFELSNLPPMYLYGMRSRGFSPGCQPMEGLILRCLDRNDGYHDCLLYDRKLTDKELREYEMDFIEEVDTE